MSPLERMLPHIKDVYQLCIVSYTLALMKSSEADLAYSKLMNSFSESDGKIYWSPTPITVNRLKKNTEKFIYKLFISNSKTLQGAL